MPNLICELSRLGILDEDRLEQFYPRVRDREDVAVLRDPVSEVIVLSRSDHVSSDYYEARTEAATYSVHGVEVATTRLEDNLRRAADFGAYIRNKRWLDFGCGLGGMLDELGADALWAAGLEPNRERASIVSNKGHKVIGALDELEAGFLDVVTLFHVLEHMTQPLATLIELRTRMKPGGLLLVEVPHARDALFTTYDCEAFKKFTFWSEHLVLHTRHSLKVLLETAGFENVEIMASQRYPLANHLYWLAKEKPGGHGIWRFLSNPALDAQYEEALAKIERTDTLVAYGYCV
jgi:2-polyprenyl-3-methyl-5-hydroxy-6-metoxy-1,4-benzoquinol methylase